MQEDVDDFMKKSGHDAAESVLKDLDEQHQKYKFMELNLLARKKRLGVAFNVNTNDRKLFLICQSLRGWGFNGDVLLVFYLEQGIKFHYLLSTQLFACDVDAILE